MEQERDNKARGSEHMREREQQEQQGIQDNKTIRNIQVQKG